MSGVRMFVAGIGALINIVIIYLLLFAQGVIIQPLTEFMMSGTYRIAYGINMVPLIWGSLMFLALGGALLSIYVVWQEVFAEVSYYPEY